MTSWQLLLAEAIAGAVLLLVSHFSGAYTILQAKDDEALGRFGLDLWQLLIVLGVGSLLLEAVAWSTLAIILFVGIFRGGQMIQWLSILRRRAPQNWPPYLAQANPDHVLIGTAALWALLIIYGAFGIFLLFQTPWLIWI
jgi:hypothetical protein